MTELKKCPFCGSEAKQLVEFNDGEGNVVMADAYTCSDDGCLLSSYDVELDKSNWNTRPLEDAMQAKLDEALTDLHDTTAQLIMDEGVRDALAASCNERGKKAIAYNAMRQDAEDKLAIAMEAMQECVDNYSTEAKFVMKLRLETTISKLEEK